LEDREAFEKGWKALSQVPHTDDATLTLVSQPVKDLAREELGLKPPGRPVVQIRYYRSFGNHGEDSREVAVGITLFVDGKIVDLNRVPIPAGWRIVDQRTLPVATDEPTARPPRPGSER